MFSMSVIYPGAFIMALTGLLGWTFLSDHKKFTGFFRSLFVMGFVAWALAIWTAQGVTGFKLGIIFRDLLVLGVASLAVGSAKANRIVGLATVVIAALFVQQFYLPVLQATFSPKPKQLAPDAEYLIELNPRANLSIIQNDLTKFSATMRSAFQMLAPEMTELDDCYLIDVDHSDLRGLRALETYLRNNEAFDWVEENELIQVGPLDAVIPTQRSQPVGVNDPKAIDQWALQALQISDLHQLLTSSQVTMKKSAIVAVLDTGVDSKHEDLTTNYQSLSATGDRDGNGHGTHVAGIVGATTNNRLGIASMAARDGIIKVAGIKVLSDGGFGSQAKIIQGMLTAADLGADVISMSLGGPSSDKKQNAYTQAVEYCNAKGAIVVVAAGNASVNAKTYAPANTPGVLTVSAINSGLKKTSFTNEVQDIQFALAAPGENILSTYPKNQYRSFKGTSMATPFVSSLVGILKSIDPTLDTPTIFELLSSTGKDSDQTSKTGKVIQPNLAVQALIAHPVAEL